MRWDWNDKGLKHWQKPKLPACVVKDHYPKLHNTAWEYPSGMCKINHSFQLVHVLSKAILPVKVPLKVHVFDAAADIRFNLCPPAHRGCYCRHLMTWGTADNQSASQKNKQTAFRLECLYISPKTICRRGRSLYHHKGTGTLKMHLSVRESLDVCRFKGLWNKLSGTPWGAVIPGWPPDHKERLKGTTCWSLTRVL